MAKAQVRSNETTKNIKKGVRDTIENVSTVQFVNAKSTAVIRLASNALALKNVDSLIGTTYADAFVITDFVGDLAIDAKNGKNTFNLTPWQVNGSQKLTLQSGKDADVFTLNKDQAVTINAGAGTDEVKLASGSALLTLGENNIYLSNVEKITGTATADDIVVTTFKGDKLSIDLKNGLNSVDLQKWVRGDDQILNIKGGSAADTFTVLHGQVVSLDGAGGADVVNLFEDTSSLENDGESEETAGAATTLASNSLMLSNIESLVGSSVDDVITVQNFTGSALTIDLQGGANSVDTSAWKAARNQKLTLKAEGGEDTFTIAKGQVLTIQAGEGADTVSLTGAAKTATTLDTKALNLSDVEVLLGTAENDILTVKNFVGDALTILSDASNDALNISAWAQKSDQTLALEVGAGDDTVSIVSGATVAIDGGEGEDVVTITNAKPKLETTISSAALSLSEVEQFNGSSKVDLITIVDFEGESLTVDAKNGNNRIDASNWIAADGQTLTLIGGKDADVFTVGSSQSISINGGNGKDKVVLNTGTEAESPETGDNDPGSDPENAFTLSSTALNLANIETVEGSAADETITLLNYTGSTLLIDGKNGDNTFDLSNWQAATNQKVTLKGGSGVDTFVLAQGQKVTIDGGAGDNSVSLSAPSSTDGSDEAEEYTTLLSSKSVSLQNIQTLTGTELGETFQIQDFKGTSLTIDAGTGANTFNASKWKAAKNQKLILKGGVGSDTITSAASGTITIDGGGGGDLITLGKASEMVYYRSAETITGLAKADTLVLATHPYVASNEEDGDTEETETETGWTDEEQVLLKAAGKIALADELKETSISFAEVEKGLDIIGNSSANSIVGTAYNDTLRFSAEGDTLSGNGGIDTYVLSKDMGTAGVIYFSKNSKIDDSNLKGLAFTRKLNEEDPENPNSITLSYGADDDSVAVKVILEDGASWDDSFVTSQKKNTLSISCSSPQLQEAALAEGTAPNANKLTGTGKITLNKSVQSISFILGDKKTVVVKDGSLVDECSLSANYGTVTFTSFSNGVLQYSYTLTDNAVNATQDALSIYADNGEAISSIKSVVLAKIKDDAPVVTNPAKSVFYYYNRTVSGNIAVKWGADGAAETDSITTSGLKYGALNFDSLGNWTYTLDDSIQSLSSDLNEAVKVSFIDADGSKKDTTLKIGVYAVDKVPPAYVEHEAVSVSEAGLTNGTDETAIISGESFIKLANNITSIAVKVNGKQYTIYNNDSLSLNSLATPYGTLTFTDYNAESKVLSYSYTLNKAPQKATGTTIDDTIQLILKNGYASTTKSLAIASIADDKPAFDENKLTASMMAYDAEIEGDLGISWGADGARASKPLTISKSEYGTFNVKADGTYTFTRTKDVDTTVAETLTATAIDKDGSVTTKDFILTISTKVTDVPSIGACTSATVSEAKLARGSQSESGVVQAQGSIEIQNYPETVSVVVDNVTVPVLSNFSTLIDTQIATAHGTIQFTEFKNKKLSYTYTLNEASAATSDSITLIAENDEGTTDNTELTIAKITDDAPVVSSTPISLTLALEDNSDTVSKSYTPNFGADGACEAADSISITGGQYGTLSYSEGKLNYTLSENAEIEDGVIDTFNMTLKDADGSESTQIVNVNLLKEKYDSTIEMSFNAYEAGITSDRSANSSNSYNGTLTLSGASSLKISVGDTETAVKARDEIATKYGILKVTSFSRGVLKYTYVLTKGAHHSSADATVYDAVKLIVNNKSNYLFKIAKVTDGTPYGETFAGAVMAQGVNTVSGKANFSYGADSIGSVSSSATGFTINNEGNWTYTRGQATSIPYEDVVYTVSDSDISSMDCTLRVHFGDLESTANRYVYGTRKSGSYPIQGVVSSDKPDVYKISLNGTQTNTDKITFTYAQGKSVSAKVYDKSGNDQSISLNGSTLSLASLSAGDYYIEITTDGVDPFDYAFDDTINTSKSESPVIYSSSDTYYVTYTDGGTYYIPSLAFADGETSLSSVTANLNSTYVTFVGGANSVSVSGTSSSISNDDFGLTLSNSAKDLGANCILDTLTITTGTSSKILTLLMDSFEHSTFTISENESAYVNSISDLTWDKFRDNYYYNSAVIDAEKSPNTTMDDDLCWAGTASNLLKWTKWGDALGYKDGNSEDRIFQYFVDHTEKNSGYTIEDGLKWFFNGSNYRGSTWKSTNDGTVIGYDPSEYVSLKTNSNGNTCMQAITEALKQGNGVGLSIRGSNGLSHAITCWGYSYDSSKAEVDSGYYTGIFISDSDDDKSKTNAEDGLKYCKLNWNGSSFTIDYDSYYKNVTIYGYTVLQRKNALQWRRNATSGLNRDASDEHDIIVFGSEQQENSVAHETSFVNDSLAQSGRTLFSDGVSELLPSNFADSSKTTEFTSLISIDRKQC